MRFRRIVILTGAGVSAESGMGTFRDKDGIWTKHSIEDVATPQGFQRNPELVHDFYNQRRAALKGAQPNAAHTALADLEQAAIKAGGEFLLVTQNVDNLHEKAGSKSIAHMHGQLDAIMCNACGAKGGWSEDLSLETKCWKCGEAGGLRPDVVWFGEVPYFMDKIGNDISKCDLFVSIGTSGEVYPAAGFVYEAILAGAHTVELNLEPSSNANDFVEGRYGPATKVVREWVEAVLGI